MTLNFRFSLMLILMVFAWPVQVLLAQDDVGLGNGSSGALTINAQNVVINTYTNITSAAAAKQDFVLVGTTSGFAKNDLVMIWQTAGDITATSSATGTLDINSVGPGRWEFVKVSELTGSKLTFSTALKYSYLSRGAQVIRVPQYTQVTNNASIVAIPWNGSTGGIVVFLANATVNNNGSIFASGSGFRGGQFDLDDSSTMGSTDLDLPAPFGGAKGEGIEMTTYSAVASGRGSVANGGGGGNNLFAGGGGGGNFGAGGLGGRTFSADGSRLVGGYGGDRLYYHPQNKLLLGGGGGAGHGLSKNGGTGGGVVFFRANTLTGNGVIAANGNGVGIGNGSGAGGGAGGTVYVRLIDAASCTGTITAFGGAGGSTADANVGPGGGGGGGSILFQKGSGTCNISGVNVAGGQAGTQSNSSAVDGASYGATNGEIGTVTQLSGGFILLDKPLIVSPSNAESFDHGQPLVSGTTHPNAKVTFIIKNNGSTILQRTVDADGSGNFSYQIPESNLMPVATLTIDAVAFYQGTNSSISNVNTFTVSASVLPVDLIRFKAKAYARAIKLEWATASERDNARFDIYRSTDGITFAQIGSVNGNGTSSINKVYHFEDRSPMNAVNYYRLVQVDLNGSAKELGTSAIDFGLVVQEEVKLYPNPAREWVTLEFSANSTLVELVDANGKVVKRQVLKPTDTSLELQLTGLSRGSYFIRLHTAKGLVSKTLIKN